LFNVVVVFFYVRLRLAPTRELVVFTDPLSGKRREVDLSQKSCVNPLCPDHRKKGKSNLRIRRVYGKLHDRLLLSCATCGEEFSETRGTAYYNVKKPLQTFFSVLFHLNHHDGIRDTALKVGVHRDTVMGYGRRAAEHCRKVEKRLLRNLKCIEIQLDELWSFVKKKKKNVEDIEEYLAGLGDRWTWVAFDPVSKFVIGHVSGKRVEEKCMQLLELVSKRVAKGKMLLTSDELPCYASSILRVFGKLRSFPPTGKRGRPRKPCLMPDEDILYGTVHKERKKGRVVKVEERPVYGTLEEIQEFIKKSPVSNRINTSFVERKNLDIRHRNRRMARKTQSFSKDPQMHDDLMHLTIAYGNFCRVHSSIKQSPAMALGITDHIWSIEELMSAAT